MDDGHRVFKIQMYKLTPRFSIEHMAEGMPKTETENTEENHSGKRET